MGKDRYNSGGGLGSGSAIKWIKFAYAYMGMILI